MIPNHIILGVHITDRFTQAVEVQRLFTEYGKHIKTRLGLHDVRDDASNGRGVVLLELIGDEAGCAELEEKLDAIDGVEVKSMVFNHQN